MSIKIPFNKPSLTGNEYAYMQQAIENGRLSGDGIFTLKCHNYLEKALNVPKVLLTTSCTHALEMCALLLNIQPGDEIILPSFTFVSTANAFVLRGAKPVFIDIRPDTLNMDERQLESLITPNTKAIIPVHYAGIGCEMDSIMKIAQHYQITVIEDAAHGLFGKYKGRYLGTFGALATQSFHDTKNFTCGEGGALLINDEKFIEPAEIYREKGTDRSQYFRGQVDKYSWVEKGSSYLPSDLLAAFLLAQLESREQIQTKRQKLWDFYNNHLGNWAKQHGIQLPQIPAYCDQAYHMYYIVMPSLALRTALIDHLKNHGIQSVFHYVPLHISRMGRQWGGRLGDCPHTESISERLLRLPFFNDLTESQQHEIVKALHSFTPPTKA
ncbi:MAG: dTDP-4-amino-4,6-dideoxygalactose transaminase [Chloroflexi bacterium]|nr:MAG: dTDP-4-amino-4,6-dideoxygalactose transaminase [Chloroflexota bacterium]